MIHFQIISTYQEQLEYRQTKILLHIGQEWIATHPFVHQDILEGDLTLLYILLFSFGVQRIYRLDACKNNILIKILKFQIIFKYHELYLYIKYAIYLASNSKRIQLVLGTKSNRLSM